MNENPTSKKMSGNQMDFTITPPKLKKKRGINLLLLALKLLVCILGPLTVPTIVYGVEGCSTTFWWILGMAFFTSLILLAFDIQKTKDFIVYLKINQRAGIRCLIKTSLMLLVCGVGTYAYSIQFYEICNVCLFVTGVITGSFSSDITAYCDFRRKKDLPYVNFTKNSPKPLRPMFLDLRRKSFNISGCATNSLPLKRQLSSPTKKSSNPPSLDEVRSHMPLSARPRSDSMSPTLPDYPSSSSSSSESDGPDVPQQVMVHTPTKRRVISPGLISLSPSLNSPKTSPISNKRLEFPRYGNITPLQSPDNSHMQTAPSPTYTECNVENMMSQNFSFFHM